MSDQNEILKNWIQVKIREVYGTLKTKKISLPPKIEWEIVDVPYEEYEQYTETTVMGTKKWVYFVVTSLISVGILFVFLHYLLIVGIGLILLGIGFYFFGKNKFLIIKKETKQRKVKKIKKEKKKKEIPQYKEEVITGEWSIKKIGKGKLKFMVKEINGTKYLSALDFSKEKQKLIFPYIEKQKEFLKEYSEIEKQLENTPYVLNGTKENFKVIDDDGNNLEVMLSGLEKEIMGHFISAEYWFSNIKKKKIDATLFQEDELKNYLRKSNDNSKYSNELFDILINGQEFDNNCKHWIEDWTEWNTILQNLRSVSINNQVVPEFEQFSNLTHYSSFNFYCPYCNEKVEKELLQRDYSVHNKKELKPQRFSKNTRCFYIVELNAWKCPMCEKVTISPIPLHKTLDEILFPVYDNLMEENKNEREKDYSDVRKKEIQFKNEMKKELEKMYFDNLNRIYELKDEIEKMNAEIEGESEAIRFINQSIRKYKKLQSEIIKNIEISNEEMKLRIQATASKVLSDIDRIKNREMELLNKELTQLSKAKRLDDERRDAIQRDILSANREQVQLSKEQNQILNTKFDELITTNKGISSNIKNFEETFKKVSEDSSKNQKELISNMKLNNSMQAARNRKMGIDVYDENSLLHPGRALKHGFIGLKGKLTGKSTMEIDKEKLNTFIK